MVSFRTKSDDRKREGNLESRTGRVSEEVDSGRNKSSKVMVSGPSGSSNLGPWTVIGGHGDPISKTPVSFETTSSDLENTVSFGVSSGVLSRTFTVLSPYDTSSLVPSI